MAANLNTGDPRRAAREAKRDHDKKAKWAYGGRPAVPAKYNWCDVHAASGCGCDENKNTRPAVPESHFRGAVRNTKMNNQGNINQLARGVKTAFRHEVIDELGSGPSDSSAEEDIKEASAAPQLDIMYSYDAAHGPGRGSQILGMALARAVEKFETKETEKLVKEYEFVGKENDAIGDGYVADDDDFEIIDRASLA